MYPFVYTENISPEMLFPLQMYVRDLPYIHGIYLLVFSIVFFVYMYISLIQTGRMPVVHLKKRVKAESLCLRDHGLCV